ncbi:MAG TPA: hypothetical protein VJ740_00090 [Hyphomicrobiaceae bacterium]|nr:hypothetical protein [Hyphomicrobiaceae bacterium]
MKVWLWLAAAFVVGSGIFMASSMRTPEAVKPAPRALSFDERVKACVDEAISRDRNATRGQYEPICRATTQRSLETLPDIRPHKAN